MNTLRPFHGRTRRRVATITGQSQQLLSGLLRPSAGEQQ